MAKYILRRNRPKLFQPKFLEFEAEMSECLRKTLGKEGFRPEMGDMLFVETETTDKIPLSPKEWDEAREEGEKG